MFDTQAQYCDFEGQDDMPLNDKKLSTPSSWAKAIAVTLIEYDVDASAVFETLGMDYQLLDDKEARYWQDSITQLWKKSVELTGDQSFGLKVGAHIQAASYPALAYSLMSCNNLKESCKRLFRYQQILADGFHFNFKKRDNEYCLSFDILPCQLTPNVQAIDATLVSFLSFIQWVTLGSIKPLRASLKREKPDVGVAHAFSSAFNCPITYQGEANCLYFSEEAMAFPLPTADEVISKIHDANANQVIENMTGGEFSTKVRNKLIEHLPSGEPKLDKIALELNVSSSTLKRRLQSENSSFKSLLDQVREQLAIGYLENRDLSLTEITYLLGFSESSVFNRAFKRWKGISPRQWQNK